ncbi:hypothetical protein MPP7335_01796 [Mycolicibacterium parafortuitum]|uniref:Uncharacterized protein n=1 Tax=Mycolicibacterium parafortuitum TaxID=39692 RepID=A0A375YG16_MYCPF|nr:hypothetical protein MPP7335_01796 [Mycolicibacterium parafortuitum]
MVRGKRVRPRTLSRLVDFCRTGYPPEVPSTGFVPLLALLPPRQSS